MSKELSEEARKVRANWENHWALLNRPMNWNTAEELEDLDKRIDEALRSQWNKALTKSIEYFRDGKNPLSLLKEE